MKRKTTNTLSRLALCAVPLILICSVAVAPVRAQDAVTAEQTQTPTDQQLSEGQIEQLVAPIALYPDPLLSQVLMASTYPLEVIEAARWSQANSTVKGEALQDAMQSQSWDPSVKALAAVPQTLQMMSDKLDWTQQLGDAFLAQQQQVLAAVQTLRAQAQAKGNLQSTPQQTVTLAPAPAGVAASGGIAQAITIQPVNPDVYYVPVYNPAVAYGPWDYPSYPPFYWSPPGFVASNVVSFAAGVAVGSAIWGQCDWWHNNVIINVNNFNAFNHINLTNNTWNHNPEHRHGVPYHNASLAARFGGANDAAAREAFRDRAAAQRGDVFGDRADTQHPDAVHRMTGEGDDAARRIAPAQQDRREGDIDRRADRPVADRPMADRPMPERQEFARPRGFARPQVMRSRAQAFRPQRRAFGGGGVHFGGGGRRRL
ncbi:DUF3300 domain-containing protein [Bradyrhizobium sp.]|jgi:hypothetical protein|uniref:DUF3300 domain-containing protein n=1 Tax=Bradyrhizobium sp. TaxID=376 RepID=UPI003C2655D2